MREFTPEWRSKLSEAAKKRHSEGRNTNLQRGGAHLVGAKNPKWKGEETGYEAKHAWVRRTFHRTGICQHCGAQPEPITFLRLGKIITRDRLVWANISGEYRRARSDWIELCWSCHAKMDGIHKNFTPEHW